MSVGRLWLARHAQPLVAPGICYGALDVATDPAATADSARRLAAALPRSVVVRHSPLSRCELLAHALISLRPDLTAKPDARLAELDFGNWEGQAWSAIARADIDAWTADFATHRPGGGESLAEMLARVASALDHARGQREVLWITHAGVARCVQWLLNAPPGQMPRADQWPATAPAFGQWAVHALG